jgi:hypothetical protein
MIASFKRVFQRIKSKLKGRTNTVFNISHDSNGLILNTLSFENISDKYFFSWADVKKVTVFKRDLLTVDLICLTFELSTNTSVELNEEMAGWDDLTKRLPDYLPGCTKWEEWFMKVFKPAFETNAMNIFIRNSR